MPSSDDPIALYAIERALSAHRLAQYVTRNRCERYLRLALFPSEAKPLLERYRINIEPLSPLLSEEGQSFEREKVEQLNQTERLVDLQDKSAESFFTELGAQPTGRTYYYQPRLEGTIGGWRCEGYPDLVRVDRNADGSLDILVIDIKASARETVGYRVQVAFYAKLLLEVLRGRGLKVGRIQGALATREADFSTGDWNTFDLGLFTDEIEHLVAVEDSDVTRVATSPFESLPYQLGPHCDGCPNGALCFIHTAEREDLSLVPLLTASEKSALRSEGIDSARELASLMRYGKGTMETSPGLEEAVARIGGRWPLGSRLPELVQRARSSLKRFDPDIEVKHYIYNSHWGSLPDEGQYPDLVKVFVDAHRDYIKDHIYLIAGLVVGPDGSAEVVEMTSAAPDLEAERDLLVRWLQRLLPTIAEVADTSSAPLHVYLYDRRGQSTLLGALARHFEALCAIPAFYDLLTSQPALTQGMISFLAEEVRARRNVGIICQNLYQVAHEMGFKWRDGETQLPRTFRARVFDSQRPFERDAETGLLRSLARKGENSVWVESASRFGTDIPLEYAYAVWGILDERTQTNAGLREQLAPFLGVTAEEVKALALMRTRALRFIEEAFTHKNKHVEKQALELDRLDQVEVEPGEVPLHRSLEDFLLLEHHAVVQERLLHLSLPPEQRVQTGRTAILRCESYEKDGGKEERAVFTFSDLDGEPVSVSEIGKLRFREDDWVVLNRLRDEEGKTLPAKRLIHGRLAVIERIGDEQITLRLLSMNFKNSTFRYTHGGGKPEPGLIYTIDEMVDDLNADKFLEACRNAPFNTLYHWLSDPDQGKAARKIRPKRLRDAKEIADLAVQTQRPQGLTPSQYGVVGDHLTDKALIVQGPPGTGKSHTLGFAVLSRALALSVQPRPFRVAVAAKTHAATKIALQSIAKRARQLLGETSRDSRVAPLGDLRVVKVSNDPGEELLEGVESISADGGAEGSAAEQWAALLEEPLLVIGGTPGGLYNLIKRGAAKGKAVDWTQAYFDLVVVDEASQMGIAEALTAAAFLNPDGQFIAIGDHRQMPPILAHAWDQESRRDLKRARPHLSIFEYLKELGFQIAALDQSFRVPAEVADFLQRHIYSHDGIQFRSDNLERIDRIPDLEGWLRAALDPDHPLVVIEHNERGSQQENEFEASLVEELVSVAMDRLNLDARDGIGVVVPHRAQKALLRARLPKLADAIDTVERFQGGERDLIIVSATVSDRDFAVLESGFLLDPRRMTVAISRPKRKLIVISSRTVFDLIPSSLDEYERGALWKHLRHECSEQTLWAGDVGSHRIAVRAVKC